MRREPEPKPFVYIDIPLNVPRKDVFEPHNRFNGITGKLELNIKVTSSFLFVGSGNYDYKYEERARQNLVYYSFFRSNGNIAIPGSSIKGAARSILEAISNSCISQVKGNERYQRSHSKCKFDLEKNIAKLCIACRLFGTTGYGGRVHFDDALPIKSDIEIVKIEELFSPKISYGKRKFYQNKKFTFLADLRPEKNFRFIEAVKKDSIFKSTMSFENLNEAELSLLLYSLGIYQDYMIKIGGAKPRCLGAVIFTPKKLKLWKDPFEMVEKIETETESYLKEIMTQDNWINKEVFDQLKKELKAINALCPKGVY